MDSLTQAALGASVGVAVMGRSRPIWQSALAGALIGTLPDLDVFFDKGDPVRDMVLHRAETHALFWQALVTPFIAFLLAAMSGSRPLFLRWCALVAIGLFTHSLLDAMTIYGTRFGLPFTDYPFGLGSLFIIDPIYTLPLLIGVIVALSMRRHSGLRWNTFGLILSTLYAGWSIAAQAHVSQIVQAGQAASGLPAERILVTPTPFNTLLWRVVLVRDDDYLEGFYSLLDPPRESPDQLRYARYERDPALDARTGHFKSANLIRTFSKGFYQLSDDGRQVRISDLRMGQTPYFAFTFAFAEHQSEPLRAIAPQRTRRAVPLEQGLSWLWQRLQGNPIDPPGASKAG